MTASDTSRNPVAVSAGAPDERDTDWSTIAALYGRLMSLQPSPVVALSRAIAIAQSEGPERALAEIDAIVDRDRLLAYPFYHAALGELHWRRGLAVEARHHFEAAVLAARNPMEKAFLERRVRQCRDAAVLEP